MADSRIQKNSSDHSSSTYAEGQLKILDAEFAADRAAARAGDAAFKAASHRPAQKNMTPELDANDFGGNNFNVIPAAPTPKPRAMRKGK